MAYNTKDIYVMDQIEHIRKSTGMYIGSTEKSTRLVEELLDNSLDEVQAGYCNEIRVTIDTKENCFSVTDFGRGIPFDPKVPDNEDIPVIISTQLFSSGKFNKESNESAYKIASGLHGVGMVAVNALSDWMSIEIYRNNKYASYEFINANEEIIRKIKTYKKVPPFSTNITIKPSASYFTDPGIDIKIIRERLIIACANFPNLKIHLVIDDYIELISGTENDLISSYLTESNIKWIDINLKKDIESCTIKLGWDDMAPISPKILSCVNLVHVHSGTHINLLLTTIKNVFESLAKKYKYEFDSEDSLVYLRSYMNLKIVKTSFEAQVKVKLESKSDLSVMDQLGETLKKYLEKNDVIRTELLEKFQDHRKLLRSKKVKSDRKRTTRCFTKLRDCNKLGGELLIGEGDSAVGGLINVRDKDKHAILPLRGVITNVLKKSNWLSNIEVREIIQALGTGTEKDCDINKLRYSKIILAADADPAGKFITTLLIVLFAKLTPAIIKAEKLFVCQTPLYGIREKGNKLIPIWEQKELETAREKNLSVKRFKGLGEFNPSDLKVFTLDEKTRRLIKVNWSDKYKQLFKLMTSSSERRKLVLGSWSIV